MKATTYICDPRPTYKFQVTAVRYTPEQPAPDGVTLIFAHGNATHKETWSTMLSFLYEQTDTGRQHPPLIKEAWSIECPNHGESAVLNEDDIAAHYPKGGWNGWEYPQAMLAFIKSRPDGIDFSERKLVGVGHSNGAGAILLLQELYPNLFSSVILMDPAIAKAEDASARYRMERIITQYTWSRQDTWRNRKEARKALETQEGSRYWHPKVMDAYLEKGLRLHPASKLPEPFTFNGVTLACSKAHEAAMTRTVELYPRSFEMLKSLYASDTQVHLIIATLDKFNVKVLEDAVVAPDPVSGRGADSVQRLPRGGHMFVQTEPELAAHAVQKAISAILGIRVRNTTQNSIPDAYNRPMRTQIRAHL
ncbi:Alpha/beta hydrolase fold-1 [Pholiota molesta]|nr:Alpha/beta hydrolase fold-1 [Pholiota molesta]